ncbi:hypothetical protein EON65_24545 [archaeon]|nr:MAG: hypothetical protein EON65_24545 [archaeon]
MYLFIKVRLKIVPAARAHDIYKLLEAVDYHIKKNNYTPLDKGELEGEGEASQGALLYSSDKYRRGRMSGVMIEYILIKVG